MKISNQDVIILYNTINKLKQIKSTHFSYYILKLQKQINNQVEVLKEVQSNSVQKVDDEMKPWIIENLKKNENGGYSIDPKDKNLMQAYLKEESKIKSKYEKEINEYDEILKDGVEFDLPKLSINKLPNELTGEDMDIFVKLDLIDEV